MLMEIANCGIILKFCTMLFSLTDSVIIVDNLLQFGGEGAEVGMSPWL